MAEGEGTPRAVKASAKQAETFPEPVRLDLMSDPLRPPRRLDFAETLAHPDAPGTKLSVFLLDLYASAVREPVGCFERSVFVLLQELVPFDAAWTGVATKGDNRPINHNSFTYRLPEDFFREWLRVRDHDPLADLSSLEFGRALVVDMTDAAAIDTAFTQWAGRFGLVHLLRICAMDNRFGLIGFMSIYRRDSGRPFTPADVETIETVIPHLAAAMRINRTMQLFLLARDGIDPVRRAICDAYGVIHRADEGFAESIEAEWPGGGETTLPEALRGHLRASPSQPVIGPMSRVEISPVAGLFVLELRPRSVIERLGARELETIQHFANGASYKEVARTLNISPATVRHHLRSAYRKLGVHDKAQISRLISNGGLGTR